MHPYATDSNERKFVPFLIAVLSIGAAWLFYKTLGLMQLTPPWWFDAPSVMGFYGLFYSIFEKWLWSTRIMRMIRLVKLPDLNGTWKGYAASSFDEHSTKHDADIEILQSWKRIKIILKTKSSESHSLIAALITENPNGVVLNYEYLNEPKVTAKTTMHAHRGTARLILRKVKGSKVLDGEYYTGRDRQNYGMMHFKRSQRK